MITSSMFQSQPKKHVLLRAPVLTQSGYGVHARQIVKWLMSRDDINLHIQALPWGDTPWLINKKIDNGLIGRIMEKTVDPTGKVYDASVQLQLPNEWDASLAKINIGVTACVETDTCNPEWIDCCNKMSAIVIPSAHSKSCFTNTGAVTKPMFVIPESYAEAIDASTKTRIDDLKFSTPFNFLLFGQLTGNNPENDRKNIFYTIKWFCEAFQHDEEVGLIVKTNAGRNTKLDRRIVTQLFSGLLREVRKNISPKIHLLHGDMTDAEVASLYRHDSVKAMVSLTRGEGFGLPILEAAASGLPMIATGWSGHTDFLRLGKYIDIDYKLNSIDASRVDNKIFMKTAKWAHPSEDDFKKKITKFRNNSMIPAKWAADLSNKIKETHSLTKITKTYEEVLKEFI